MSTSVKHIHNGMRGAPQISGSVGTLIAALDAILIDGWGSITAVSVSVTGGVATATLNSGETFAQHAVVLVAGATPSALNGEARVITTSSTSITWATTAADGAATGTITIKYAPQTTWAKVYSGTNKAVYLSSHVQSNGHYLRVDDTGTTQARVRGYEGMTDVDTGTGPFPTDAQVSGGGIWQKSTVANATANRYRIVCDERLLLIAIAPGSGATPANLGCAVRGFGDATPLATGGDAWSTVLSAWASWNVSGIATGAFAGTNPSTTGALFAPRALTGLGSAVSLFPCPYVGAREQISGADAFLGALPSTVDGRIRHSVTFLCEAATASPPRIDVPGIYSIPQNGATAVLTDGGLLDGAGGLAGRKLLAHAIGSSNGAPTGIALLDITGPWR